eukprot:gene34025-38462_t
MCSDVDRNDKSRVCEPGSVKVIGRRQIEMYSRLIHTVDHIEGRLRDGMDAFDGFLSHAWAVTVTGAPKLWAMRFIEAHEKSPRAWYGGAIGMVGFNGDMNTGLTLRTVRIKDGIAEVRAGATLLNDSDPQEEEAETELKASAMIAAIRDAKSDPKSKRGVARVGEGVNILLVDHEDSFVHTLANYFRQTGATVNTLQARGQLRLLGGRTAGLAHVLVEQVFKHRAAALVAIGGHVRQVVGDRVQLGLLGFQAGLGDREGTHHGGSPVLG